jgi:uncharacterized protein (DUF4415 family)
VPEKAEAFLRVALSPASCGLLISVANCARLAAPDRRKASFFQTHHGADRVVWRVVVRYENSSALRNKYAGNLSLCFKFFRKSDDARALSIPSVIGLKKTRAFLIERGPQRSPTKQPVTVRYSPEVIAYFKSTGQGWQTRMNDALSEWVAKHQPVKSLAS